MLEFWGKAYPAGSVPYHPAAYHCLDVAATARVMLGSNRLLRDRFCELLGLAPEQLVALLTALVALHDLGKFSRPFQVKRRDLWPTALGDPAESLTEPHHDAAGFYLWRHRLADDLAHRLPQALDLMPIARAIFGHHGSPVAENSRVSLQTLYGQHGLAAAREFASTIVELVLPAPLTLPRSYEQLQRASYLLAGMTIMADWIGSNQRWFQYTRPHFFLGDYWHQIALPRAADAVRHAGGVVPVPVAPVHSYARLTGIAEFRPTPMQEWAATVALPAGPILIVIEDATGSGKTEAAVMLAHRLMASERADGLFVALPTMATANAMFERLAVAYRRLFAGTSVPSLALAHSARALHPQFTNSILDVGTPENVYGEGEAGETASSQCAAWIADDRRKAFLAEVGVGTVDQAILSVLPSRHHSLRLVGLAQRVLILDEVHAYDAYMSQEIVRMLEFHAALGGSAILLSATLPADVKRRLSAAYGGHHTEFDASYPLASVQSRAGFCEFRPVASPTARRNVSLRFLSSPAEALDLAQAAARNGQAVLYIRNTIADAMETFNAVDATGIHVSMFHARYAMCDRLARERDVLAAFGKSSCPQDRQHRLLVATQVVEQSLDLDFDLIVSDLAPIDLIIQRAGRLWRHTHRERPAGARRELAIVTPEPLAAADPTWLDAILRRTTYVYKDLARLWMTAAELKRVGSIETPDGLRPLIEAVYGPRITDAIPTGLLPSLLKIEEVHGAHRGMASHNLLRLNDGYTRNGPWELDTQITTRLGEETRTLRLAREHERRIIPWATMVDGAETDLTRLWALSEVRVSTRQVTGEASQPAYADAIAQAKFAWSDWDRQSIPLVVLTPHPDGNWRGLAAQGKSARQVACDQHRGLTFD
jgi:CRISPR-associated endonuclease/helicase Cas3